LTSPSKRAVCYVYFHMNALASAERKMASMPCKSPSSPAYVPAAKMLKRHDGNSTGLY